MFVKTPPEEQEKLDSSLRPASWKDYFGQEQIKKNLRIIIDAAKQRGDVVEHLLFYGNSGLGKTSLASVVAKEMGREIKRTTGPALERAGDIASLLTNLQEGEILFVDEIHRISKQAVETLYSAMEDFVLHLVLGRGPMARTMDLPLPRFTLIGSTTRVGLLPAPFRNRFGAVFQLGFYDQKDIEDIVTRSATILGVDIDQDAIGVIASRSRFTPRVANRLLKRVRDFATVQTRGRVTGPVAKEALAFLGVDELGLEDADRKILEAIIQKFSGGPVGIEALAATLSEDEETILDLYEPFLLQLRFVERTPRGRIATKLAHKHLNLL